MSVARTALLPGAGLRAETLVEALPYIRRFAGKTIVVKYGGNALAGTSEHDALALFAEDIVMMRLVGMRPVVVHGGGPQISALMKRLGKETEFVDGLRVTDAETVDIARMVLKGQVNPQVVAAINVHGNYAVGVSRRRRRADPRRARDERLGFVGDVTEINPEVINGLLDDEFIPVIATIGSDETGQAFNINADTVAGVIAEALDAEKLIYLTDIEGLRTRRRRPGEPDPPDHGRRPRPADRRRHHRRRHDPEGRQLPAGGPQRRATRPTSWTGESPTSSCSNCSPTTESEPW